MAGHMREKPPGSGRWELIAYEGQDASGRKRQRSRMTPAGQRLGKREAAKERDRWALQVTDEHAEAQASVGTVSDLLDRWLLQVASSVKESTLYTYQSKVRRQRAALGHLRVEQVAARDVERFYAALVAEGLAAGTLQAHHDILKVLFAQAVRWGEIDVSPMARVERPRAQQREPGVLSVEDEELILAACDAYDLDLGVFARLAASTGARRGELCGLRWSNVDLDTGDLFLQRNISRSASSYETTLKAGRSRHVGIDAGVASVLQEHADRMEARALFVRVAVAERGFVFSRDPRCLTHMNPNLISGGFRAVRKLIVEDPEHPRPDLAWVRLHDLRHSMATVWLQAGVPVSVVSRRLGHSSSNQTLNIYAHVLPGAETDGLAKVDQFRAAQGRSAH